MSRLLLACVLSLSLSTHGFAQEPSPAPKPGPVAAAVKSAAEAAWAGQDWDQAASNYQKVVAAEPKNGEALHRLGYSLHALGKLDAALEVHQKLLAFPQFAAVGAYNAACVHALQGRTDEAFAMLDKAVALGMNDRAQFEGDSDLDSLRKDARYGKLMEKFGRGRAAMRPRLQVYPQTTERMRNRLAWFSQSGSPGQLSIEYGAVPWQAQYAEVVGSEKILGKKWRLGSDFWTSLDTSVALTVGGVEVPAGYYYLTLEQRDAETFVLALHDAAAVRKQKLDAYVADRLQGGIEVKMHHEVAGEVAAKLAIEVALTEGQGGAAQNQAEWRIAFGPHRLTAPVVVDLGK